MSADLWMGLAIGSVMPWIVMIVLIGKRNEQTEEQLARANAPTELLKERNTIGEIHCLHFKHMSDGIRNLNIPRRERIAVQALQGYLAGRTHDSLSMPLGDGHHAKVANGCLTYTDALIAALDGKEDA